MAFSSLLQFAQDATTNTTPTELQSEITNQLNNNVNNVTTTSSDVGAGIGLTFLLLYLVILVFYLICSIKIYQKAGRKWWEAIIPIYNVIVLLKIVGRPIWWVLLLLVPFVNLVVTVILAVDLAKVFKKDAAFGVLLLWLLSFIGYPMLAFGSATYAGPEGNDAATTPQQPSSQPPADSQSSNSPSETPTTPSTPPSPNDTLPPTQPPQSPPTNLVQ